MDMIKKEKTFGLIMLVVILLGYIIPFTILREVYTWYGSFLWWSLLAIIAIITNYQYTKSWEDDE